MRKKVDDGWNGGGQKRRFGVSLVCLLVSFPSFSKPKQFSVTKLVSWCVVVSEGTGEGEGRRKREGQKKEEMMMIPANQKATGADWPG